MYQTIQTTGATCDIQAVHTTKIMQIKFESIRIVRIHTEAALTAMRIQCAFGQSTSIGGLKPISNCNPLTHKYKYLEISNSIIQ